MRLGAQPRVLVLADSAFLRETSVHLANRKQTASSIWQSSFEYACSRRRPIVSPIAAELDYLEGKRVLDKSYQVLRYTTPAAKRSAFVAAVHRAFHARGVEPQGRTSCL